MREMGREQLNTHTIARLLADETPVAALAEWVPGR